MTCQLDTISFIEDILSINKYLNVESLRKEQLFDDDGQAWNELDWSWGDQPVPAERKSATNCDWLQDVTISMSATEEFIAIANQDKIVFLTQKWDYNEANTKLKYVKCFEGSVTQDVSERITCVLCIPLASQKRSTNGASDWTCIMVGFNSGYVRIYTENGTLLISQIFSEDEILKIKCRTYITPRHPGESEHTEEVCILYKNTLVTIDGFSFFQSIKACKNQVARATASGGEMLQPPPLAYKKWALLEQTAQKDFIPCGVVNSAIYEQIKTDSLIVGAHASPRSTLVAVNLYISTGSQPFLAFYYTQNSRAQPLLSDVAHAVASRLKSAFLTAASGWLGISGSRTKLDIIEKQPKIEPATNISPRFGLFDKRRCCSQIELSSNDKMAAVVDDFGRVLLIDVPRGVVVRMWKGYRDAQVAWVDAREEDFNNQNTKKMSRFAFFLVIYAPRRGLLEIWVCQMGARIATYTVGKTCRLLSPSRMLGLNSAIVSQHQVGTINGAAYLVHPDGNVVKIVVPFHLALGDKGSVGIHDMHLLKRMRSTLKDAQKESDSLRKDLLTILKEIKTPEIKKQALDQIMSMKCLNVAFLIDITENFVTNLKNSSVEADKNYMLNTLLHLCQFYIMLLQTYANLFELNKHIMPNECVVNNFELLNEQLSLSDKEAHDLDDLYTNYFNILNHFEADKEETESPNHVRFKMAETVFTAAEFVSHFECKVSKSGSTYDQSPSNGKTGGKKKKVPTATMR